MQPLIESEDAPVTDARLFTSFLCLRTPKKAKTNASLKSINNFNNILTYIE